MGGNHQLVLEEGFALFMTYFLVDEAIVVCISKALAV